MRGGRDLTLVHVSPPRNPWWTGLVGVVVGTNMVPYGIVIGWETFNFLRRQARLNRAVGHHRPAHTQEARDRAPLVQVSLRVELLGCERTATADETTNGETKIANRENRREGVGGGAGE